MEIEQVLKQKQLPHVSAAEQSDHPQLILRIANAINYARFSGEPGIVIVHFEQQIPEICREDTLNRAKRIAAAVQTEGEQLTVEMTKLPFDSKAYDTVNDMIMLTFVSKIPT